MKRFAISLVIAASAIGAAHADPVMVQTPKAPLTVEAAEAYVAKLDAAVKQVCRRVASPIIGTNYNVYISCVKATRADVGRRDPTGLYVGRDSAAATVVAAK